MLIRVTYVSLFLYVHLGGGVFYLYFKKIVRNLDFTEKGQHSVLKV